MTLTSRQAYEATYHFVNVRNKSKPSTDIDAFLGSMKLRPNGDSLDPAMIWDWKNIVNKNTLTIEEAQSFAAAFLRKYANFAKFKELRPIATLLSGETVSKEWESAVKHLLQAKSP